jgi:cytochrome P450
MLKYAEAVVNRLQALIEKKRRLGDEQKDALSLLMNARDSDVEPLSDDELIAEAVTLYIAGHETTAITLAWTLLLLERHPAIHAALMAELDVVLGGRDPEPDDLQKMVLLDRVIKESMRVLTTVPTLFMRVCADAATVGGFAVPKNSNVIISPLAAHHDPTLYPEPERFLPDRWLNITPSAYEYLPFGVGSRNCIGMLFAERALRLILPMILQRFRFSIPADTRIDRLTRVNILQPRHGLPMRIEPASAPARPPAPILGDIHELLAY